MLSKKTKTVLIIWITSMYCLGLIGFVACYTDGQKDKCVATGCKTPKVLGSDYCNRHDEYATVDSDFKSYYCPPIKENNAKTTSETSSTVSKTSNNTYSYSKSSYDKGYDDVYEDEDYDDDKYYSDDDYALGVDDAMEDWNEEYGEDW